MRSTMSYGMIADIDRTEFYNELLYRADKHMGSHSILYFAVPVDMTEIERRAYYYITMAGQLKKAVGLSGGKTHRRCHIAGNR